MSIILKKIEINDLFKIDVLEIQNQCLYGVLGQNGSGKSTLLKILAGQKFPTNGHIKIDNKELDFSNYNLIQVNNYLNFIRKVVRYIPTEIDYIEHATIEQNIRYILNLNKLNYRKVEKEIIEYMSLFEIRTPLTEKIKNISFGNRKKILLIVSFFFPQQYLLYDEPTLGLDKTSVETFFMSVQRINKTVVIASHEQASIYKYCNVVLNFSETKKLEKVN